MYEPTVNICDWHILAGNESIILHFFVGNDTVSNCTAANDTVCSRCETGLIWSDDLTQCVRCGPCCSNNTVDSGCSEDPAAGCIYDPECTKINEIEVTAPPALSGDRCYNKIIEIRKNDYFYSAVF